MTASDMKSLNKRMDGAVSVLAEEFAGLRTGRASTTMLERVSVDAYGAKMQMDQVGTISVPEPRLRGPRDASKRPASWAANCMGCWCWTGVEPVNLTSSSTVRMSVTRILAGRRATRWARSRRRRSSA